MTDYFRWRWGWGCSGPKTSHRKIFFNQANNIEHKELLNANIHLSNRILPPTRTRNSNKMVQSIDYSNQVHSLAKNINMTNGLKNEVQKLLNIFVLWKTGLGGKFDSLIFYANCHIVTLFRDTRTYISTHETQLYKNTQLLQ